MKTSKFTYSIHFGLIAFLVIYLLLFDYIPGGEESLMYISPIWFLPIIFGISGHLAVKLKKENPVKFAGMISIYALALATLFFKAVWPML